MPVSSFASLCGVKIVDQMRLWLEVLEDHVGWTLNLESKKAEMIGRKTKLAFNTTQRN